MSNIKLTKFVIDKIPLPETGQLFYRDSELRGFGLRVGKNSKVFFCEKKINGRAIRVTLGSYPTLSVDQARRQATGVLSNMLAGIDINSEKRDQRSATLTLDQAYQDFKASRHFKDETLRGYDSDMTNCYGDWLNKQIGSITKDMVEERHRKLAKERGKNRANRAGRTLRSVLNFAIKRYELSSGKALLTVNPFDRISDTRQWFRSKKRSGHLKSYHLPALFQELDKQANQIGADYIRFVLLTGCRRNEAAALEWIHVDRRNRSFLIVDPKNHNPIELPLSTYLIEIIERRWREKVNHFVFPARSKTGHVAEPKSMCARLSNALEHDFCPHDLRRSFVTIAASLEISHYALKALVNHKMPSNDVTAGYLQLSVEQLREPMQRITDFVLREAKHEQ